MFAIWSTHESSPWFVRKFGHVFETELSVQQVIKNRFSGEHKGILSAKFERDKGKLVGKDTKLEF